jgi:hypothetical protein
MSEPREVQRDLQALASSLKQLEGEYNQFFSGRLTRPPLETRKRVEALVKKWERGFIQSAADRFQFDALQRRFQTLVDLWDRGLRAREEGRPGPFPMPPPSEGQRQKADHKIIHVTTFQDPMREMDKLHTLYDSLMDARREVGEDIVPFHRFAALVKDQVSKARSEGADEVAFRVSMIAGKVNLTVRPKKGGVEKG